MSTTPESPGENGVERVWVTGVTGGANVTVELNNLIILTTNDQQVTQPNDSH